MSVVLAEDIERVLSDTNIPWNELQNAAVLVTGATGLIGNIIVRILSAASEKHGLSLRIIAHGRNAAKGEALSQSFGVEFISGDIRDPLPASLIADKIDYIFHCAAITNSADMVAKPVDVIGTAIDGTRNILELAKAIPIKSMVYLSSMEVYGQPSLNKVSESDLGYLDLSSPRSSYPESKRLCESLCNCYFAQYSVPVKTARLAQTFGAGSPKEDTRVFAQFARSAISGENIILHTDGKSRGNYCYISDAIKALLILLLKGKNGEAYNIANSAASITIREMAELVAKDVCGGEISVTVEVPADIAKRGYAPNVGFKLDTEKISQLGWKPRYGLAEMYRRMIRCWAENA